MRVVTTGSFDGNIHDGHLQMLTKAARLGEELIVFVVPDWVILKYKQRKPLLTQEQRVSNLRMTNIPDKVLPMTGGNETENLYQVLSSCPDLYVFGGDQFEKNSSWNLALQKKLHEQHAQTIIIPRLQGVSTTSLHFS